MHFHLSMPCSGIDPASTQQMWILPWVSWERDWPVLETRTRLWAGSWRPQTCPRPPRGPPSTVDPATCRTSTCRGIYYPGKVFLLRTYSQFHGWLYFCLFFWWWVLWYSKYIDTQIWCKFSKSIVAGLGKDLNVNRNCLSWKHWILAYLEFTCI